MSRLWPWARKMRGVEDCVTVQDPRQRGWNGVERVKSLGPVTLQSLGRWRRLRTAARVGPAMRLSWGRRSLRVRVRTEGGRRGFWVCAEENRNEGLGLDYRCIYIYIYMGGIFVISWYWVFIRVGFRVKSWIFLIKPRPVLGFFLKPILGPLGLDWAGYPRVGQKLPSLPMRWVYGGV